MKLHPLALAAVAALTALPLAACDDPVRPAASAGRPSSPRLGLGLSPQLFTKTVISVTDLGTLGQDLNHQEMSRANAINDSGVVTGTTSHANTDQPYVFRWRAATGMKGLIFGEGLDINGAGVIVGRFNPPATPSKNEGFVNPPNGVVTLLGNAGPQAGGSEATGVADDGWVVGNLFAPGPAPFYRDPVTKKLSLYIFQELLTVDAVNASHDIVGRRLPATAPANSGYLRTAAGGLEVIPGSPVVRVIPTDLTDARLVVGWSHNLLVPGPATNVAWTWASGAASVQPLDANGQGAAAFGVNQAGYVVGAAEDGSVPAFWTPAGNLVPLPRLMPAMVGCPVGLPSEMRCRAEDINAKLQIVGADVTPTRHLHAVMWQIKHIHQANGLTLTYPISLQSTGRLSVVLLGSRALDVRLLPADLLTLGDDADRETPVARRQGRPLAHLEDFDGDGADDLIAEFSIADLVRAGDLTSATTQLVLSIDFGDGTYVQATLPVRPGGLRGR